MFKAMAYINSLNQGKMRSIEKAEITVLEQVGDNDYILCIFHCSRNKNGLQMANRFTKQKKFWEIFPSMFPYKIKLFCRSFRGCSRKIAPVKLETNDFQPT